MNYNVLRKVVSSCVEGRQNDPHFRINMFKLRKLTADLGLVPLVYKESYNSKRVMPDDIPLLMEYFKEDKIEWLDSKRTFLTLIFIRQEDLVDNLQELTEDLLEGMYKPKDDEEILPGGIIQIKSTPVGKKKKPNCKFYCPKRRTPDIVSTLGKIVGTYPCYTCIVAKHVRPDAISLYIRFRANSVLLDSESSDTDTSTDTDTDSEVDETETE